MVKSFIASGMAPLFLVAATLGALGSTVQPFFYLLNSAIFDNFIPIAWLTVHSKEEKKLDQFVEDEEDDEEDPGSAELSKTFTKFGPDFRQKYVQNEPKWGFN